MIRSALRLVCGSAITLAACDKAGSDVAAFDANSNAADDHRPDAAGDAPHDGDAGICVAPLDTFPCPVTYPARLETACAVHPFSVSVGQCGALLAIIFDSAPHFSFCLYQGADGGTLVGAEVLSDTPEFCSHTAETMSSGQTAANCTSEIYGQALGQPGSGPGSIDCRADASQDGPTD
jgi:hypothetical protein